MINCFYFSQSSFPFKKKWRGSYFLGQAILKLMIYVVQYFDCQNLQVCIVMNSNVLNISQPFQVGPYNSAFSLVVFSFINIESTLSLWIQLRILLFMYLYVYVSTCHAYTYVERSEDNLQVSVLSVSGCRFQGIKPRSDFQTWWKILFSAKPPYCTATQC